MHCSRESPVVEGPSQDWGSLRRVYTGVSAAGVVKLQLAHPGRECFTRRRVRHFLVEQPGTVPEQVGLYRPDKP